MSQTLGNSEAPLNVIVSGSGYIDLGLPVRLADVRCGDSHLYLRYTFPGPDAAGD